MINTIWGFLIIVGIIVGIATGKTEAVNDAIMNSAGTSVTMAFSLIGIYCLWLGILKIAEAAGIVEMMARKLRKILAFLFKGVSRGSDAMGYISLNIVANMLGMGNAATPFGLKAMDELQKLNKNKKVASDAMCMLLIINTSSVQLLPLTLIGLRSAAGSANPAEITLTSLIATAVTTAVGIIAAKICERKWK